MKKNIADAAALHFAANESHEKYHVTSDGNCFLRKDMASAHSATLPSDQREVTEVDRKDVAEEIEEARAVSNKDLAKAKSAAKAEADAKAKAEAAAKAEADAKAKAEAAAKADAKNKGK